MNRHRNPAKKQCILKNHPPPRGTRRSEFRRQIWISCTYRFYAITWDVYIYIPIYTWFIGHACGTLQQRIAGIIIWLKKKTLRTYFITFRRGPALHYHPEGICRGGKYHCSKCHTTRILYTHSHLFYKFIGRSSYAYRAIWIFFSSMIRVFFFNFVSVALINDDCHPDGRNQNASIF